MRQCRGKRKDKPDEWIYGWYIEHPYSEDPANPLATIISDERPFPVIPATVGQATGLKDKNDVEIFEGDIVQWHSLKLEIHWGIHARFMMGKDNMTVGDAEYSKVIGNIHDNPEPRND